MQAAVQPGDGEPEAPNSLSCGPFRLEPEFVTLEPYNKMPESHPFIIKDLSYAM